MDEVAGSGSLRLSRLARFDYAEGTPIGETIDAMEAAAMIDVDADGRPIGIEQLSPDFEALEVLTILTDLDSDRHP